MPFALPASSTSSFAIRSPGRLFCIGRTRRRCSIRIDCLIERVGNPNFLELALAVWPAGLRHCARSFCNSLFLHEKLPRCRAESTRLIYPEQAPRPCVRREDIGKDRASSTSPSARVHASGNGSKGRHNLRWRMAGVGGGARYDPLPFTRSTCPSCPAFHASSKKSFAYRTTFSSIRR